VHNDNQSSRRCEKEGRTIVIEVIHYAVKDKQSKVSVGMDPAVEGIRVGGRE
jgi:hypothetical protein